MGVNRAKTIFLSICRISFPLEAQWHGQTSQVRTLKISASLEGAFVFCNSVVIFFFIWSLKAKVQECEFLSFMNFLMSCSDE